MKFKRIVIATAKIEGVEKEPYWFDHHCYWAWSLRFTEASNIFAFYNKPVITLSKDKDEAWKICDKWKKAFKKADIHEGDTVALICNTKRDILAIGSLSRDCWVDVYQNIFTVKKFKDLKINVSSLIVC